MSRTRTAVVGGSCALALSAVLLTVGALTGGGGPAEPTARPSAAASLSALARTQERVKERPGDASAWAGLAVLYVGQARTTGDPSWYAKAEGAVARSLALDSRGNYLAYAGQAALANARHDFRAAEAAARRGLAINAYNSTLYGALGDALTQLGRYDEAAAAVDRMNQLLPGVPAFTRASYVFELRGDVPGAQAALDRALKDAVSPSDVAFAQTYLGELALRYGEGAAKALPHFDAALQAQPGDAVARAGRARALATLGRTQEALVDYRTSVSARPEPSAVLELGQLLQATGDTAGADEQYALFQVQAKLYAASGVALDTELTLFEADHGSPARALAAAQAGWRSRPFVEMADAYAWALHVNRRDREALEWSRRAFASGWSTAPALYHRGVIRLALGERAAALADLRGALRLDPGFDPLKAQDARRLLAGS